MFELNGSSSDDWKTQYALYQIDNLVGPPFRTATLVESETIEGQIGEGCRMGGWREGVLRDKASATKRKTQNYAK